LFASFKIGTVFGITIRVAWIFLVMALGAIFLVDQPAGITALLFATLFVIVLLHELGHSLVALYYGIHVVDITFWPLGGMARMSEIPESPKIETLIAIAGPAVNFALAALATPILVGAGVSSDFEFWPKQSGAVASLAWAFIAMNLMLGLFNLLPAFPMDGGRVLRATLGIWSDWVTATRRAVKVGRVFAVLMMLAWWLPVRQFPLLAAFNSPVTPLIGLFIWFAGTRELWAVRVRHGDIPMPAGAGPRPAYFEAPPPSVATNAEPDPSGARRPTSWPAQDAQRRGLDAETIARLENFQGRLRNVAPPE
jgi:Zn-dependent protease